MALVENISGLTLATIVENISVELKSLKISERKDVALFCVACAIGNRKLASQYISECVKKIIAKEIFVINATFKFSVFAILGHYLMKIYPDASVSKAFAEKLGAKDIWSAKNFSKFSEKRAPILKEFSNKYSYNSELAKSIKKAFSGA